MCGIAGVLFHEPMRTVDLASLKSMAGSVTHRGRDAEKIVFASGLKASLAQSSAPRTIDPAALEDYLAFGVVPGTQTIFAGIEKLAPGHTLLVGPDCWDTAPQRYWQLRLQPDPKLSVDEWQEAIRAKLDETVRLHLIADVPVGAFLSGGLDSSLVVALAAGQTRGPLQTFSMGFQEESFSELPYARRVARQFGTAHVEAIVTADAVELLDELTKFYDEPFADPSAIPTYLVSRLAAKHAKVVLSGDGGDEAF